MSGLRLHIHLFKKQREKPYGFVAWTGGEELLLAICNSFAQTSISGRSNQLHGPVRGASGGFHEEMLPTGSRSVWLIKISNYSNSFRSRPSHPWSLFAQQTAATENESNQYGSLILLWVRCQWLNNAGLVTILNCLLQSPAAPFRGGTLPG